jgi:hypothetical protein
VSDTPRTDELAKREFVPDGLWIKYARELERENAALREDKARLDWLTNTGCWLTFPVLSKNQNWRHGTARDVIDLARKEAQP